MEHERKCEKKVGLALSGGAVLGMTHLGVVKVLEEYSIPIHCIAGTSAGSMVGAFLAAGYTIDEVVEIAGKLSWGKLGRITFPKKGVLDGVLIERFLEHYLGDISFKDLSIPFAATAFDLEKWEPVILSSGKVAKAVRASCAIPGLFTPVELNGRILFDGGFSNFFPVEVARSLGAEYVIGSKLIPHNTHHQLRNIVQIVLTSVSMLVREIASSSPDGNTTITPDLTGMNSFDFGQMNELIQRGEEAALRILPQIKADLFPPPEAGRFRRWVSRIFGSRDYTV